MNSLYFVIVLAGSLFTWYWGAWKNKQAKTKEKWILSVLLVLAICFTFIKKFDIPITMPSEFLIQWIAPWMQQLMIKE